MITNDSPFPSGEGQAKESMKPAPLLCPQLTVSQAPDSLSESFPSELELARLKWFSGS